MKHLQYILLFAAICSFTSSLRAQEASGASTIHASVIICEAGDVLYSTIGHAAIHMQSDTYGMDYVYSYEGEDVSHQILTFLRGNLKMGMFAIPAEMFITGYRQEERGVKEYPLQLSEEQMKALWKTLDERVAQGSNLPYDYFQRGCAITIVEILHEALGETVISYGPWPEHLIKSTRREIVRDAIVGAPWQKWILYMLIGTIGDSDCTPEDKLIVPQDLADTWQSATIDGHPLLGQPKQLVDSSRRFPRCLFPPMLVVVLLFLLLLCSIIMKRKQYERSGRAIGLITIGTIICLGSMMSLIMTWLVCFSGLPCTEWNWLLIPFNALVIAGWEWRRFWAKPFAAVVLIWSAAMLLWPHMLVDPAQVAFAILFASGIVASCKSYE